MANLKIKTLEKQNEELKLLVQFSMKYINKCINETADVPMSAEDAYSRVNNALKRLEHPSGILLSTLSKNGGF